MSAGGSDGTADKPAGKVVGDGFVWGRRCLCCDIFLSLLVTIVLSASLGWEKVNAGGDGKTSRKYF